MIKVLTKILNAVNSNKHPGEIAHAVSCAMLLGFLPKNNALWYLIAVFCLFLNIHKGAFVLCTALFSFIAPSFDNFFDSVGYSVLHIGALELLFAKLLDIPFVAFTRFNNTIVAGALVCSVILYIPLYGAVRGCIALFRRYLIPTVRKTKLIAIISKLPLIKKLGDML
ncbi:MAG: TIGR03546 family protein [Bacteroides sp.]|nr:TIGR03546 family protein [Prevotella sp.]MCM1407886.1 TIGR03546 family protein [Treponema brennaborense]MCM1469628.1 TIGR03546 family protein [Bacteroides sp.]